MNRYLLKIDPIRDCVGGFGQSRISTRWEGGEIAFMSNGPKFAGKEQTRLAPAILPGDELWIWTHEDSGGQGLVARASVDTADNTGKEQRVTLKDVVLVQSPFGFDKFRKRPDNGYDTGTRLLDYASINRGTAAYLIEDDDYPSFLEIVERFGGVLQAQHGEDAQTGTELADGFSWNDEIAAHKDEILVDLVERRSGRQKVRSEQPRFRADLVALYNGHCALSGCFVPQAVEAAHVLPHDGTSVRDRADNGILLRRDLHAMFDAMLWSIDPDTNRVHLSKSVQDRSYAWLHEKEVKHHIAAEPLRVHFIQFRKAKKNA